MATVNVTLPVDVAPIAAPLLFTTLIHWYLYGALAVQVYLYYHAFPHDALPTQGLVYSLFAAGSAQMALGTRAAFRAYASHFGDTAVLAQRGWLAGPVLGGLVTAAVQLYYAQHVHALGRSRSLQILTSSLALTQGAAALVAGAQRAHGANDAVSTAVWLAACAACDVAIACAMLTLFLCPRTPASTAAAAPPAARASRAVRLVVASGVLTALASTTTLILHFTFTLALPSLPSDPSPSHAHLPGTAAAHSALASASLLALLNARARVAAGPRSYAVSGTAFTSGFGFAGGEVPTMCFAEGECGSVEERGKAVV